MPKLIVIICTHNPRQAFLDETLSALRAQTIPPSQWDLLLVDNASKEPLAARFDLSWHPRPRIVREDTLGTAHARLRALREAEASDADLLLFVDDDNILAADYIEQGLALEKAWPQLGCWGGQLLARYEAPPPNWLENYKKLLAICPLSTPIWTNKVYSYDVVPPTAGGFIRRSVWRKYLQLVEEQPLRLTLGAKGEDQVRGEDTDLVLSAIDVGLGVGRFPQLSLEHIMPAGRISVAYLENLIAGVALGTALLEYLRHRRRPEPVSKNWLHAALLKRRAGRLPEPIGTFYRAELRGRSKAEHIINGWARTGAGQRSATTG
jgi:glycosyltransferase involved in cell wall biosynthesis